MKLESIWILNEVFKFDLQNQFWNRFWKSEVWFSILEKVLDKVSFGKFLTLFLIWLLESFVSKFWVLKNNIILIYYNIIILNIYYNKWFWVWNLKNSFIYILIYILYSVARNLESIGINSVSSYYKGQIERVV